MSGRADRGPATIRDSLQAAALGLAFGVALHFVTLYFRDYGPSWDGTSLKGNGAIVVLLLAPVALLAGELWCLRRRAWLGMALLPVAIFLGLFVVFGTV
jgi:hypothetical protein